MKLDQYIKLVPAWTSFLHLDSESSQPKSETKLKLSTKIAAWSHENCHGNPKKYTYLICKLTDCDFNRCRMPLEKMHGNVNKPVVVGIIS